MITHWLRRLQGRAERLSPSPPGALARGEPGTAPDGAVGLSIDAAELERRFLDWIFDLPEGGLPFDAGAAESAFAHMQVVAHRFDVRRMPRLPALVPQLLAAMRHEETGADDIASLLGRDPTLAGEVMRVAGSAFYRRANPPAGLPQAVQAIGHEGLRHVIFSSVMRPILRGDAHQPGYAISERLWDHAQARTWLCGRLAASRCDVAEAQLAGIVAGTGIAALARMMPGSLLMDAAGHPGFARRFLAIARPLSTRAGSHWHLPAGVLDALQSLEGDDAPAGPVGGVLRSAERLAMGYRLVECGRLEPGTLWPTGAPGLDAPAARGPLFEAMAREIEATEPEPAVA